MARLAELNVIIAAKLQGWDKELGSLQSKLKKFDRQVSGIGRSLSTSITLPILAIGGASIKMASDLQENQNKVDVIFKESSKIIHNFAQTTIDNFGIAKSTALDMAGGFGDMATSMGFSTDAAADMSIKLVSLAADMASLKNISIEQAQTALSGIFSGQTEALTKLGSVMTVANVEAFALSKGIRKGWEEMSQAEKVALRYAFVLETQKNATGDFARTGGGAANQMRIFQERLKELSASFGEIVLPAFTNVITKLNDFIKIFQDLDPELKKNIINWTLMAAAIGPLLLAVGQLTTGFRAVLSIAGMMLTPVGGVIAAILATAAAVIYLKENWEALKNTFSSGNNIRASLKYLVDLHGGSIEPKIKTTGPQFRSFGESLSSFFTPDMFKNTKVPEVPESLISDMFKNIKVPKVPESLINDFAGKFGKGIEDALKGIGNGTKGDIKKKIVKPMRTIWDYLFDNFGELNMNRKSEASALSALPIKALEDPKVKLNRLLGERGALESAAAGTKDFAAYEALTLKIRALNEEISFLADRTLPNLQSKSAESRKAIFDLSDVINATIGDSLAGFAEGIGNFAAGLGNVGNIASLALLPILDMMETLGKMAIATGIAIEGIKKALLSLNPFAAIGAGIALIALSKFVKGKLKGMAAPKLAEGGLAHGPTLATVGDNPNARIDPEVISPLSKLKGMLNGGNNNTVVLSPELILRGRDLVLLLERNKSDAQRRGINYA